MFRNRRDKAFNQTSWSLNRYEIEAALKKLFRLHTYKHMTGKHWQVNKASSNPDRAPALGCIVQTAINILISGTSFSTPAAFYSAQCELFCRILSCLLSVQWHLEKPDVIAGIRKSDKKRIKEGIAENNLLSMSSLRHQSERRRYRAFQRGHKCTLEEKSNKRGKNRKEQRGREEEEGWCVLKNLSLALMTAQQRKQQKQTKVSKTSNESFL